MPSCRTRAYGGWQNCLELEHEGITLLVTTDIGPRILRCSATGDDANLFGEFTDQLGRTESDEYLLFGGHRLWHSPEAFPRSYSVDLDPVEHNWDGRRLTLMQRTEENTCIQKSIEIDCRPSGGFRVRHQLVNEGPWPIQLAAWAMTVMAPGSHAIVPQEEFRSHPEYLHPARTITLWHYTRMDDPRVRWGQRFIQLEERSDFDRKFKVGIMNRQRWAACAIAGHLFVKTFAFERDATYPDGGCNCEMFTMPGFLELESLGALRNLESGQSLTHNEDWHLWSVGKLPLDDETALDAALRPYLDQLSYPDI